MTPMRDHLAKLLVASLAVLILWPAVAHAQGRGRGGGGGGRGGAQPQGQGRGGRGPQPGFVAAGVPEMPNPPGPAPKQELTGTWVGPISVVMGAVPPMTAAGQAARALNIKIPRASDVGDQFVPNNDPFAICDPLGIPRVLLAHWLSSRGGIEFVPAAGRMLMLFEHQRVWREIWMDGRQLPAKVDERGFPDSRFYGYSVGRWDGDNVFVIDTVGLDPRSWLEEAGLPHTNAAKLQERWRRVDQYHLEATVTVNDPQYYTQPFELMKNMYYWKKDQNVREELCLPSEALEYNGRLAAPSGFGFENKP